MLAVTLKVGEELRLLDMRGSLLVRVVRERNNRFAFIELPAHLTVVRYDEAGRLIKTRTPPKEQP